MGPRYGRLKRRRKALGDSQEEPAFTLGAATSTIGCWEPGEIAPSDYSCPRLAGLFRVTLWCRQLRGIRRFRLRTTLWRRRAPAKHPLTARQTTRRSVRLCGSFSRTRRPSQAMLQLVRDQINSVTDDLVEGQSVREHQELCSAARNGFAAR